MSVTQAIASPPECRCSRDAGAALVGELIRHLLANGNGIESAILDRLEHAVRTYEVEFRGYLNGQGQRPPLALGAVLDTVFGELAAGSDSRGASAFRVDALEARFHVAQKLLTQRLERCDRRFAPRAPHAA
jgi:hypothetical protein